MWNALSFLWFQNLNTNYIKRNIIFQNIQIILYIINLKTLKNYIISFFYYLCRKISWFHLRLLHLLWYKKIWGKTLPCFFMSGDMRDRNRISFNFWSLASVTKIVSYLTILENPFKWKQNNTRIGIQFEFQFSNHYKDKL